MNMKKDLYNASQTTALRLNSPVRLKIHCRGEPEAVEIYHKRYFPAIENPLVEVVVPVLNEERTLKANIEKITRLPAKTGWTTFSDYNCR